jgi:hypothetical protein
MTEHAVAYFETCDSFADLDDLAREILAQDEGIFDPGGSDVASDLVYPIEGINGHCVILDHYLVLAWV